MAWRQWARVSAALLAFQRALAVLVSLVVLLSLIALLAPGAHVPAAVAGGSGDPAAGSDSPGHYVAFDFVWELSAQSPNVSEAPPAGLKNETGLGNISWPFMEESEFMTLLKERPSGLENEPVDKEAPQEGHQAVPLPEGNSEALQPAGVDKRFSSAEDAKADPDAAEGAANTGADDAEIAWDFITRAFLVSVVCSLIALLLLKVLPAWTKDIQERLAALRASSQLLGSGTGEKEFVVEV